MGLLGPTKKQLGERSQAHIIARLLDSGYKVLVPYGDSSRYDLVIEDANEQLWRVQCKTAWIEGEIMGLSRLQPHRSGHVPLMEKSHTVERATHVKWITSRYTAMNFARCTLFQQIRSVGLVCACVLRHRKTTRKRV